MCVQSGYKTVTPIQIANCIAAHQTRQISYRGVRVFFGCLALLAIREAAGRSAKRKRRRAALGCRYLKSELCGLTGLKERSVTKELNSLKRASLLSFSAACLTVNAEPLEASNLICRELSGKRSPKRPIPVPRSVLRFVAGSPKAALGKTILGYVIRGLKIDRKSGEISVAGCLKASWVADVFGLSLRSVKSARKWLIGSGFISKDTGSFQRKLNRDGAYFRVNLAWNERGGTDRKIAPPAPNSDIAFAPPYKEKKTSNESKNQRAQSSALKLPGVCKSNTGREPILRDVKVADLKRFLSVRSLFWQAVKAGWIGGSEADFLNFVGAAVRANTEKARDPVRLFVGIVRQKKWEVITQKQEDRARCVIRQYREGAGEEHKMFHAARRTTEAVAVTLNHLKCCPGFPQRKPSCSTPSMPGSA